MAGRVILIEGLDLAGKSTLVRNLQAELTRRGIPVRVSRNALCPDNPIAPVADALRRDPNAGLLETGRPVPGLPPLGCQELPAPARRDDSHPGLLLAADIGVSYGPWDAAGPRIVA